MVSVIIPVWKEPYLNKTIQSLLDNAGSEIEILPIFDGDLPTEEMLPDPRIRPIFLKEHQGMRACINRGVESALGEWIMKCDAHCAFAPDFDMPLRLFCHKDWVMIPRRYSLDEKTWGIDRERPVVDYHFLSFPGDETRSMPEYGYSFQVISTDRKMKGIADTMCFQGSCWFAHKEFFRRLVYPLDDKNYGPFAQEQQEIGLKYWLSGGAVKVNTNVWYAHLSKRKVHYKEMGFSMLSKRAREMKEYNEWATKHWMSDSEPNMIHPFSWLVEKFSPPGWEEYEKLNNISN